MWGLSLLQDFAFSGLRKPKVHQFIKQLVNNYKIILNAFFFQLFEVLCEHLRKISETISLEFIFENRI